MTSASLSTAEIVAVAASVVAVVALVVVIAIGWEVFR